MLQRGQVEERSFPGIDYSEKVYFGFESEKENGRNSSKASIIKNLPSSDPASDGHGFGPKKNPDLSPNFSVLGFLANTESLTGHLFHPWRSLEAGG